MCISAFTQALEEAERWLNFREKMNKHHTDDFGVVSGFSWRLARLATFKIDLWTISQSLFYAVCTRVHFYKDLQSSVKWTAYGLPVRFILSPMAIWCCRQDRSVQNSIKDPGYCSRQKKLQYSNLAPTLVMFENPAIEGIFPDLESIPILRVQTGLSLHNLLFIIWMQFLRCYVTSSQVIPWW